MLRQIAAGLLLLATSALAQNVTLTGTLTAANGLPAKNYTLSLKPSQPFFVAGTAVVVNSTVACATNAYGSVMGIPDPKYPLVVSSTAGTLNHSAYYIKYAWRDAAGHLTAASTEQQFSQPFQFGLVLSPPQSGAPASAVGINIYIGSTPGGETLQGTLTGTTGSYTQSTEITTTGAVAPTTNATVCTVVANDAGWPTGTGYEVTLTDPSGNVLPGTPWEWRLLGPNTTIDLSQGFPSYNNVVTFPTPILATPYNHNTQSISGGLTIGGPITLQGTLTASSINYEQYIQPVAGEIGAPLQAAANACPSGGCTLHISTGGAAVTLSTPVSLTANTHLIVDDNALINVTVNHDVLTIPRGADNVEIEGGRWSDSVNVYTAVVHDFANNAKIHDMQLLDSRGPTPNAGLGIRIEGIQGATIFNVDGTEIYNINANTSFIAIGVSTDVTNTNIHDVYIHNGGECFDINGDTSATTNTTIHNSWCVNSYGQNYIESAQGTTVSNSHFINCGAAVSGVPSDCWYSHIGGTSRPYRTIFSGNEFVGGAASQLYFFGVSTDVDIVGNRFDDAGNEAIRFDPLAGGTGQYINVTGNQFRDNGQSAPAAGFGAIGIYSSPAGSVEGAIAGVNNLFVSGNEFYSPGGSQHYAITTDTGTPPFQLEVMSNEFSGLSAYNFGNSCQSCTLGSNADGTGAFVFNSPIVPAGYNNVDLGRAYAGQYFGNLYMAGQIKMPGANITLPTSTGTVALTSQVPQVGTPASSSATCTPPQVEFDASYLYTCVATNSWRRVLMSTF